MTLEASVAEGILSVRSNGVELLRCTAELLLSDGRVLSDVDVSVDGSLVNASFRNTSDAPIRIEQIRLVAAKGLSGARLSDLQVLQTGWQSWSRAHPSDVFEANFESAGPPIRGPYLPHRRRDSQVEPWMTILSTGDMSLLLGFVSARTYLGTIEVAPEPGGGHRVIIATELDGVALEPDQVVRAEPLLLAIGSEPELLDLYARTTAEHMAARKQVDVLSGWCSWYQLYTSVSEADVDRNIASLVARRDQLPLKLIQLDDGYQGAVGDWLVLNEKFPSGMPALVERIKRAGFVPGLWLAPFLLSAASLTYAEHPEWVVRDERGEPVNALHNWGSANYALDTTQPEARAWLDHVIDTVCNTWGFEYLKLDFLYAAAMRGTRYDASKTANQAYRMGLERLRHVAGDRFILGCGAPLVPSIGLVDGMRIGSDVAAYWGDEGNSDGPSLRNATRATLARWWMNGHWWTNDPDCVVIRASDTELSLDEVQAWMSVVAMSGGMLFIGDDVSRVEPERLEMLARLLPPLGRAATSLPPLVASIPEHLLLRTEHGAVVGIANWSDTPAPRTLHLREFELNAGPYHAVDLWSGEYLGALTHSVELGTVAPHGMRLLSLRNDRPARVSRDTQLLVDA